ncbi:UNVERIFIED_ORG: hypothetical protein J2Y81_001956 [Paraburkholderia sediminicola]|nr:hypothetical protein [Paraburkholderia sediminicola]
MPTFTEADHAYREAIEAPGRELANAFVAAHAVEKIDLEAMDLTTAVLLRLKAFWLSQDQIKSQLGKVYAAPAADFFVETVCFFLKVILARMDSTLSVASEKTVIRRQGSMRPDISVWRGEMLIAAIECKTQLGWNRDGWLREFEDRQIRLSEASPGSKLFLLVMTGSNWPGFGDDRRIGSQFFLLLHELWPSRFDESAVDLGIAHPIEKLFKEVLSHAESAVADGIAD